MSVAESRKAYLVLEDGTFFAGRPFGALTETSGEVVFNTGMTGYQEILSDPSYRGQIVALTYPLIGNYGINDQDFQSGLPHVKGLVVSSKADTPSHWLSRRNIEDYLFEHGIAGLEAVDTRALTKHLRECGTMRGAIVMASEEGVARARAVVMEGLVAQVSTPRPYRIMGDGPRIAVVDYGVKANILKCLMDLDCDITVFPWNTPAPDILAMRPDGAVLSNGPGDPKDVVEAVETVRQLAGILPVFGICLGHQVLGLALGADTYKLKYGHRGSNHPVRELRTGRVYITSQNHGYAVDEATVDPSALEVTHRNLNDGTVEGMRHRHLPVFSVQFHPEARPGPEDSRFLFEEFINMVGRRSG